MFENVKKFINNLWWKSEDDIPVQIEEKESSEKILVPESKWWAASTGSTWSPDTFMISGTTTFDGGKWSAGNFSSKKENKPIYGTFGIPGTSGFLGSSGISGYSGTAGRGIGGYYGTSGNIYGSSSYSKSADYIAKNIDKNIAYTEYIAEQLDKSISYIEYVAENIDKRIQYTYPADGWGLKKKKSKRIYSDLDPYGEEEWEDAGPTKMVILISGKIDGSNKELKIDGVDLDVSDKVFLKLWEVFQNAEEIEAKRKRDEKERIRRERVAVTRKSFQDLTEKRRFLK